MKNILTLILVLVVALALAQTSELSTKRIVVRLQHSAMPCANLKLKVGKQTATTNQFGEAIMQLPSGSFEVQISGADSTIKVKVVASAQQEKVVVNINALPQKTIDYLSYAYDSADDRTISCKAVPSKPTGHAKVLRVSAAPPPPAMDEAPVLDIATEVMSIEPQAVAEPATTTAAGKLTTGEINDFTKWNIWDDLSRENLVAQAAEWKLFFNRRHTVQLSNKLGAPILNATVHLYKDGKIEWTALTDNTGKAELWGNIYTEKNDGDRTISVVYGGQTYHLGTAQEFEQGIMRYTIDVQCSRNNNVDIAFVVDATGSMGDEIRYLQTEMNDVLQRTKNINKELNIRTASIFYQDMHDAYVTRTSPFTNTLSTTMDFIKEQGAGGGGDFPEAVDEALAVAIEELDWNSEARTRIIFLVLDAPPHSDSATMKRYYSLMEKAAAKGIRIVPLAGSGINKSTEFLMRCTALASNGTYTFLTNHSGIGNAHIEPTTDNYKVEMMNDLLIRILTQFTYVPECPSERVKTTIEKVNNDNPFQEKDVTTRVTIYPNPSTGVFFVEFAETMTGNLMITDIGGKIIKRQAFAETHMVEVNLQGMPNGVYFIRYDNKGQWYTAKVVLAG